MSISPKFGWMLFKAEVQGAGIKQYGSVKNKCAALIEKKFGVQDIESMVRKELE